MPVPYEFGGPLGAFLTMLSLPIVIVLLFASCGRENLVEGLDFSGLLRFKFPPVHELFSMEALCVVSGWFFFNVALERILPGKKALGVQLPQAAPGVVLPTQMRLEYTLNGHLQFWVATLTPVLFVDLTYVYDNYLKLAVASVFFAVALSIYLYVTSFSSRQQLSQYVSGNFFYDFFMGRELNPRIGSFDWKVFCELRPGLIGWVVINLGMLAKEREVLGYNTWPMLVVAAGQGLYVWDSLYNEISILTTTDITTEGFGFMLAFGDLAWVPFTYSLQTRFLVDNRTQPEEYAEYIAAAAGALSVIGFSIFRLANSQKDTYRRDPTAPSVRQLKTLDTNVPGKKLLISGWFGLARKINYTGDLLLGFSWSLATGFKSTITYFYPIYFFILLVHRAFRDDAECRRKYGEKVWAQYKRCVPYMFVPHVV